MFNCTMPRAGHLALSDLKSHPRRVRFLARHLFQLHRHQGVTYLVIPSQQLFRRVLNYDARLDLLPHLTGDFCTDIVQNHHAFVLAAQSDPRIRSLGVPLPLKATMETIVQPPAAVPPPVYVEVPDRVEEVTTLPGWHTRLVQTPQGPKPEAGGFRRALPHWAPYRDTCVKPMVLAMLAHGVRLRWNGPLPAPLWLSNHHLSGQEKTWADLEIRTLLCTGALEPYDTEVYGLPVIICPIMVTKDSTGKFRLIWDARYLNSFLQWLPCRFETLQQLLSLLMVEGPDGLPTFLLKIDLKAGYHHAFMHSDFAPFLCVYWNGQLMWWHALPFGVSQMPWAFETIMKAQKRILRDPLATPLMGFLDDLAEPLHISGPGGMSIPDLIAATQRRSADFIRPCITEDPVERLLHLMHFGDSLNAIKLCLAEVCEILGIEVNIPKQICSVPDRRRNVLLPELQRLAEATPPTRVPVRLLAQAAGRVVSMWPALRHATTLLWSVFYDLYETSITRQWHTSHCLPACVRETCEWWLHNFDTMNGRPWREPPHFCIEWDASSTGGGAICYGDGQLHILHVDRAAHERGLHSTVFEYITAVDLLIPMLDLLEGHRLRMRGDATFAVSYLKRGGGRDPVATGLAQQLHHTLIARGIELTEVSHIPGCMNVGPDAISRFEDHAGDWALKARVVHRVHRWLLQHNLPLPTAEGFASALNHHLPRWCSRWREPGSTWVDFYSHHWAGEVVWVNPPFVQLSQALHHLVVHSISAYLVLPDRRMDRDAPYYPLAWSLAHHWLRLPPDAFTSVSTAHTTGYHDPGYDIYVLALPLSKQPAHAHSAG